MKVAALALVVLLAAVMGLIFGMSGGFTIPKCGSYPGKNIGPISQHFHFPPIIGMILMGCMVRNFFPAGIMDAYPSDWALWIRSCCLAILLVRGGLQVSFKGKGIVVLFLSVIP